MTRLHPRPTTPPPVRDLVREREEYDALVAMTDRCEFCGRHKPLEDHHVAMGYREVTLHCVRLLLRLCIDCHTLCHRMAAEQGRALGLSLVYFAGRGDNTQFLWQITGRNWPSAELVELWIDRLGGKR